jgi:hypothetical protein
VLRYVLKVRDPRCRAVIHAFFNHVGELLSKLLFGEQPGFLFEHRSQFMR